MEIHKAVAAATAPLLASPRPEPRRRLGLRKPRGSVCAGERTGRLGLGPEFAHTRPLPVHLRHGDMQPWTLVLQLCHVGFLHSLHTPALSYACHDASAKFPHQGSKLGKISQPDTAYKGASVNLVTSTFFNETPALNSPWAPRLSKLQSGRERTCVCSRQGLGMISGRRTLAGRSSQHRHLLFLIRFSFGLLFWDTARCITRI